jgi:uncharacterized membrane protein YdjX (TVP38/TMEM64 family)
METWRPWIILSVLLLAIILVPFFLFEEGMNARVLSLLRVGAPHAAIAAIVICLLALDVFLPIPSSIVSTAAGAMLGFPIGVMVSTIGMSIGCLLAYVCGWRFGLPLVRRMVSEPDLNQLSAQFHRGTEWTLATMRPVPVLAEASALLAGLFRVPFLSYMVVTGLANAGISAVYCAVGANALHTGSFLLAFGGSILLPGLAIVISRSLRRN